MTGAGVRLGVGTRLLLDGETLTVVEVAATGSGMEVVLGDSCGGVRRAAVRELLFSGRARIVTDDQEPAPGDDRELAAVVLAGLDDAGLARVAERAGHVREVLTGYRSGSQELTGPGEPRDAYGPGVALTARYAAKAEELGVFPRTVERWVAAFRAEGEAGLAGQAAWRGRWAGPIRGGSTWPRR